MPCQHNSECCKMFRHTFGSKGFVIKSVLLLVIICAPGNLITTILLYKQWSHNDAGTNIINEIKPTLTSSNESILQNDYTQEVSRK